MVHLALVAGWLVVVLAVCRTGPRSPCAVCGAAAAAPRSDERRRVGEQRLQLAQELHDVLAHNISLINVQASVALHLIDEQPEQARPALANIKEASHDALQELRTALDVLRRGDDAPRAPAPRSPISTRWSTACAPAASTCALEHDGAGRAAAGRPSSWPPTASCRRR